MVLTCTANSTGSRPPSLAWVVRCDQCSSNQSVWWAGQEAGSGLARYEAVTELQLTVGPADTGLPVICVVTNTDDYNNTRYNDSYFSPQFMYRN